MELKDFLKLAGQQGKVVVIGEDGNVRGVFLSLGEYQRLSGVKAATKSEADIAEQVNREILQAQLEEVISTVDGGTAGNQLNPPIPDLEIDANPPERIDSLLSKRAQELFRSVPFEPPHRDYRPPQVASTSDEEISTNFDDI